MNGILLIDKPAGWTSMDVCAKLRGMLGERRIGHSGTLDPMATGLLVVFLGRATRAVSFAEADEKTYAAGLRLGLVTDTQDIWGTVLEAHPVNVTEMQLEAALARFRGLIEQVPPMYSAIKVNGQKLYDLARKGREVERKARPVTIFALERIEKRCVGIGPCEGRAGDAAPCECCGGEDAGESKDIFLSVRCSKGTYIRTLCHDIGRTLGCGGAMSALRRTKAGQFDLSGAYTLEQVQAAADRGEAERLLLPVDALFGAFPALTLTAAQEKVVRNGGSFSLSSAAEGRCRLYAGDGTFLALGRVQDGVMRTEKSFFEV